MVESKVEYGTITKLAYAITRTTGDEFPLLDTLKPKEGAPRIVISWNEISESEYNKVLEKMNA
jgi:hypothetical protein